MSANVLKVQRKPRFRGELNCMLCSRFLGVIEGEAGTRAVDARVEHPAGLDLVERRRGALYCTVCGGRAIVLDLERIAA